MSSNRRFTSFIVLVAALCAGHAANGQGYQLNFGLRELQDPATLPVSRAAPSETIRKAGIAVTPALQKLSENEYLLTTGWQLADAHTVTASESSLFAAGYNTSGWYPATVPGTVLTTLVEQGVYPDPYYGLNNLLIPDSLCRTAWWYRLELPLPQGIAGKEAWLLFNGINYRADIWLNGHLLGRMDGAFVRGLYHINPYLDLRGGNVLAVQIHPPHNPGIPHEESSRTPAGPNGGQLCLDGPTFISSEGWDWVPGIRDRNIGLWQDVRLRLTGAVTLADPQVITDLALPDTTRAAIIVKTTVKNHARTRQQTMVTGRIGALVFSQSVDLGPGESRLLTFTPEAFPALNLSRPRLWWPNGYGRPELYDLKLEAALGALLSDRIDTRFGVREFSYELAVAQPDSKIWRVLFDPLQAGARILFNTLDRVDAGQGTFLPRLAAAADSMWLSSIDRASGNPFLTIRVNGVPVFCKGGNWGMDDGMKRVSRERLEPYFRLHRDAHFNMVRNWTGESTEEVFYSLCDEYGMLVWNDFWLSTEGYNLDVNDYDLFMANAADVVKRFRNHPSIAVWCPRNEGYAPAAMEPRLQKLIAEVDGTRFYSPNSRNLNLRPSGPWHYLKDPAEYYRAIAEGFNTELGTPSLPTAATIRSFMPLEDQWPISDTWHYHDFHDGQKEYRAAIETRYGPSADLDAFCRKAQLLNYDSHRAMFESWNSRMWHNASGILLWMTHPAWPSTVWQTYSWDYETFGSFFGSKKACEPVHIQMNLHDRQVIVLNTTLKRYARLRAVAQVYDLRGVLLHSQQGTVDAAANALSACFAAQLPASLPGVYLIRLTLRDKNRLLSCNDYWQSADHSGFKAFNGLPQADVRIKWVAREKTRLHFEVSNRGATPAVALKLNLVHPADGRPILPAYFSDGYFNLLPGERKQMMVEWAQATQSPVALSAEGYNLVKTQWMLQ